MIEIVYVLWHEHELAGGEDDRKLIGIYLSEPAARAAIRRMEHLPGFAESKQGFRVEAREVGREAWTSGFFTWVVPAWTPTTLARECIDHGYHARLLLENRDGGLAIRLIGSGAGIKMFSSLIEAALKEPDRILEALPGASGVLSLDSMPFIIERTDDDIPED